ncbi:MAG: ABC transporter permease [Alcaligenaceae bacterium]|nr:ABC transporter permease [Alcaligenaceae bacterium]
MDASGLIVQLLNGLAGTSSLFLVAAGLSLIFGVTRIINFAHGSLYMLGIYIAYSLTSWLGATALGFWGSLIAAGLMVAALGVLIEIFLLRRIYRAPELFQLLATFALVLIASDAAHWFWGPEDLLGMQAPGLEGAVSVLGRMFPTYNIFLMVVGPLVLLLLWWLLNRTRWGTFVRAATQDKEMLGALGVNQAWLFTGVFALGSFLVGLGGALELPNEPASLGLDMRIIGDAFAVVVVGGMGSITGAFLAALLITEMKAICIWLGTVHIAGLQIEFSQLTMVVEFLIMVLVLVFRPWGLLGREQAASRNSAPIEAPIRRAGPFLKVAACLLLALLLAVPLLENDYPYLMILMQDALIAVLFAASLHFITGPAGMHTFGHAAYFGLGAYAAALLVLKTGLPMEATLVLAPLVTAFGALVYGWFCVRLSGIYLAMLTLAFAQITWSVVFQWDSFTGGSNGLIGLWPPDWLGSAQAYYYFTLVIVAGSVLVLRRLLFSPFGYAMRAGRDSALRSDAIGIHVKRTQWLAFIIAGLFAGLAGVLYVYSKGSVSPEELHISKSIDGLVMVLLGGVQSLLGPIVGAFSYTLLHDYVVGITSYWKALFGLVILLLVLLFPQGIAGFFSTFSSYWQKSRAGKVGNTGGRS